MRLATVSPAKHSLPISLLRHCKRQKQYYTPTTSVNDLPPQVLIFLFAYTSSEYCLLVLPLVCKKWHNLLLSPNSRVMWNTLCCRELGQAARSRGVGDWRLFMQQGLKRLRCFRAFASKFRFQLKTKMSDQELYSLTTQWTLDYQKALFSLTGFTGLGEGITYRLPSDLAIFLNHCNGSSTSFPTSFGRGEGTIFLLDLLEGVGKLVDNVYFPQYQLFSNQNRALPSPVKFQWRFEEWIPFSYEADFTNLTLSCLYLINCNESSHRFGNVICLRVGTSPCSPPVVISQSFYDFCKLNLAWSQFNQKNWQKMGFSSWSEKLLANPTFVLKIPNSLLVYVNSYGSLTATVDKPSLRKRKRPGL